MKFGFPAIDDDHEKLLSLAAEVESLIRSCAASGRIFAKFQELHQHTLGHFLREEAHMEACGYPGLEKHAREHREVAQWLSHIEEWLAGKGEHAEATAREETLTVFRAWIYQHLIMLDEPAVRFMIAARSTAAEPELCQPLLD